MSNSDDPAEPFLSRWSRRKQVEARRRAGDPVAAPDADEAAGLKPQSNVPAADPAAADADKDGEAELDLSKLPKVDELTAESDITAFLDKRVPALLRNAALGRIWTLDPTIRDFIEVAENQWNWNIPGGAPFYEEILTVPGEATAAVAQAGKGVGDLLADGSPTAAASRPTPAADDADTKLKDEAGATDVPPGHAASHNVADTSEVPDGSTTCSNDAEMPIENSSSQVAAASQTSTPQLPPARARHGGALPV